MPDLKPKRVLISGGVTRLGFKTALAFAQQGATLGLNYLTSTDDEANLARMTVMAAGAPDCVLLKGDIRTESERIVNDFGHTDVLVNNAGLFSGRMPLETLTVDDIRQSLEVNVLA